MRLSLLQKTIPGVDGNSFVWVLEQYWCWLGSLLRIALISVIYIALIHENKASNFTRITIKPYA
jgi:hypothetical protein